MRLVLDTNYPCMLYQLSYTAEAVTGIEPARVQYVVLLFVSCVVRGTLLGFEPTGY